MMMTIFCFWIINKLLGFLQIVYPSNVIPSLFLKAQWLKLICQMVKINGITTIVILFWPLESYMLLSSFAALIETLTYITFSSYLVHYTIFWLHSAHMNHILCRMCGEKSTNCISTFVCIWTETVSLLNLFHPYSPSLSLARALSFYFPFCLCLRHFVALISI